VVVRPGLDSSGRLPHQQETKQVGAGLPSELPQYTGSGIRMAGRSRHFRIACQLMNTLLDPPRPGAAPHHLLYEFTTGLTGLPTGERLTMRQDKQVQ